MEKKAEKKWNFYHLSRKDDDRSPIYDCANQFVICTTSQKKARKIASQRAGDEGEAVWLDSSKSDCYEMVPGEKEEGIIVCDFHHG